MNCFFTLLDHNDSIKICEPLGPEVINVECVYETCSHGVTLVAEHSNSLQTNSACVYFDVDIDDGFDFISLSLSSLPPFYPLCISPVADSQG